MTEQDLKEIKTEIEARILETKHSIVELEELTKPIAPDVSLGRLTRMEAISEKGINEAALRQARSTLIGLEQALERINEPGFGICIRCKKVIPRARILRVPESRVCVKCLRD